MPTFQILMAEDSVSDAELAREAFKGGNIKTELVIVEDGIEALDFMNAAGKYASRLMPDLIILDLNMPRMNGKTVLRSLKQHPQFKVIPVVILTTSQDEVDVEQSYGLAASCYVTKPMDFEKFLEAAAAIKNFYFSVATLPPDVK